MNNLLFTSSFSIVAQNYSKFWFLRHLSVLFLTENHIHFINIQFYQNVTQKLNRYSKFVIYKSYSTNVSQN